VLPIATESWPRKPVGAEVPEESLKEFHVVARLRAGPDSMRDLFLESGGWIDWTTIGAQFQITGVHVERRLLRIWAFMKNQFMHRQFSLGESA
jgi:hypothetical protein